MLFYLTLTSSHIRTENQNARQIKDVTGLANKRLIHLREGVDEMLENEAKAPINSAVAEKREEKPTTASKTAEKKPQPGMMNYSPYIQY